MTYMVACLDVWTPAVQREVQKLAPSHLKLMFAQSYDYDEQLALIKDADFVLTGWAAVTADMLNHATKLRFIEKWGIGVDRIDVEAVQQRGIGLAITAGSNSSVVAEHTVTLMLAVCRRIAQVDKALRQGIWMKAQMRELGFQLSGKTVGLLGFGNIARSVAEKLQGFKTPILYTDPHPATEEDEARLNARKVALDTLLAESDILSLHAPATSETAHIINRKTLGCMKHGAVLINTARGELVDETALCEALATDRLRGAGLDAFQEEPPDKNHPLLSFDQVVVTPHIGGAAFDNVPNVARHALGNILKVIERRPLNPRDIIVPLPVVP